MNTLSRRSAALMITTAVGLAVAGASWGQTAPVAASGSTAATNEIAEIVVTAEKKSELASRTPVALTAVTGENLKSAGVVAVSDLQNLVPSLTVGRDPFGVNLNIRGVTSTDNTSKGDQGIGFNVDGVPIGRPIEQGLAFFDVDRVEVLRGPQGTLYGKSTTGGAINVITRKPTQEFGGSMDVELGNYNTKRGNAALNVPVNDHLALRIAGNFNDRDGFLQTNDNSAARNDQNDLSARATALITFTPDMSLTLSLTGGHVGGVGSSNAILSRVLNSSGESQRQVIGNPFGGRIKDDFANENWEFSAGLGLARLTYVGAHLRYNAHDKTSSTNDPLSNYQGPPPAVATFNWRDYRGKFVTDSHELRFSNQEPGPVDWVVGANWYKEDIHESDHNWSAPATNPTLAGSRNGIDPLNNTIHTTYGVFGQATWHVTDQIGLVLGGREGHDEVQRIGTFAAGPGPYLDPQGRPCVAPNDCVGGRNDGTQSAKKFTYRAGVNFQATPSNLIYASIATGYKSGGFNDFDPKTGGTAPYEPEDLISYELGYKGKLAPNVRLNSSLFYYDYKKNQVSSLVNISGNFVIYTRAAPTKISGWENELTWRVTPNDQIEGSVVFLSSEYKSFKAGIFQNVDWSGNSLDKTPKVALTGGYTHNWDLADGSTVSFRVFSKYSGSYLVSSFTDALHFRQKAYTRTDVSLRYDRQDKKIWTELFARNLEGNIQALSAGGFNAALPLAASAAVTEPRYFGVRVGLNY